MTGEAQIRRRDKLTGWIETSCADPSRAMATPTVMRKGKRTGPALPKAAMRLIVDWTACEPGYIPVCHGEAWGGQVWHVLQLARALGTLRSVSRAWRDIADEHPIWRTLCALLDPHSIHRAVSVPGLVPSQHASADSFRRIIRATCIVCAISCPDHTVFRRRSARLPISPVYPTPSIVYGVIPACAGHRPLTFCARCLRAELSTLGVHMAPQLALAPLAANERDPDFVRGLDLRNGSGAGVRAVCGACRGERIRNELVRGRGMMMAPWMGSGFWEWDGDGGPGEGWTAPWDGRLCQRDQIRLLRSEDVAGVVTQYIEYGDWTVREAIEEMEERVWMRWWTKASEMEGLVRATARLQRMEERAAEPLDTDDESDDEDDLLSLSDEFGLREMIFQDWARNRILEGIWLSPHIDMATYHASAAQNPEMRTMPSRVAPRHPLGIVERTPPQLPRAFPWSVVVAVREERHPQQLSPNGRSQPRRQYVHTAANFYLSNPPPPNRLVYHLARAWEQAMRSVLVPAIANVVNRIARECEAAERFVKESEWDEDRERRERMWHVLRAQCVLARGEQDPCKAVSRIGPDRLVEILRGPEPWVEGGGWEDIRIEWEEEMYEVDRMREMARMRSRERDSMAPSPPPSTLALSVSAPSPTDTSVDADLHANADIHSSSTPSPESVTSPTTPSPEALRSPSTMRTTPSPPPSVDGSKKGFTTSGESEIEHDSQPTVTCPPVLPRLPPPPSPLTKKPLHPIPLVPSTGYHLGHQTKVVLELLWREATGGLWMCRCTVCVRAMGVQGVPSVFAGVGVGGVQPQPQSQPHVQQEEWAQSHPEPMQVEEEEVVEGKGKGVAGRRSREREEGDEVDRGERKRIKCDATPTPVMSV